MIVASLVDKSNTCSKLTICDISSIILKSIGRSNIASIYYERKSIMTLILNGRNYRAGRSEVSVFGHSALVVDDDVDLMVELRPMIEHVVRQAIDLGENIVSLKVNISPRLAVMLLANKNSMCRRHFATSLEGDDYIEIKKYFDIDGHSVDLWVIRDMNIDMELWNGNDLMIESLPMLDVC